MSCDFVRGINKQLALQAFVDTRYIMPLGQGT